MTSKLEQEFFEAMGVHCKKEVNQIGNTLGLCNTTIKCIYPTITDTIVLRLASILNSIVFSKIECCCMFWGTSVEEIKENILSDCLDHKDEIKEEVQRLLNGN